MPEFELDQLLTLAVQENASDLHLRVGLPPALRCHGGLHNVQCTTLTPEDTEAYVRNISSERQLQNIQKTGGADFGFAFRDLARFRVSAFKERGNYALVLRQIPNRLLTFPQLGLNEGIKDLLHKPKGLVLVTGPTGSGKSTTLASMIDYINTERDAHIITIEDPIEYYHFHKKGIVTQREVHVDCLSFAEAIRQALRQNPDVILVDEMRDLETMEAAITAAETGHLVFGTLHTTGAARTVDRIVDAFPTTVKEQVRTQLASSLLMAVSQLLLPKQGGGRIAAYEIMIMTPGIAALIRDNKTFRITSMIQTGKSLGMVTMDDSLFQHYQAGAIDYSTLMSQANDEQEMRNKLQTAPKK